MAWWNPATWPMLRKASATGPAVAAFHSHQPVWTPRDYAHLSNEGYVQNAIAYRCVNLIASKAAAAMGALILYGKGNREIEDHPILSLIGKPNPSESQSEFAEKLFIHMLLSGNAYIEKVGPNGKAPRELWALRPDRMKVVPSDIGAPERYEYEANGRIVSFAMDPITGDGEIIHVRTPHPVNDFYGLSPVEPSAFGIDRHNEAGKHNMSMLQNGATPTGALVFEPVVDGGVVRSAPDEIIQAAEERLKDRYSGSKNAGRPMVLGGNVDWKPFGLNAEQMQLTESKIDAAQDICIGFGVPVELILPVSSTFNNRREANLTFHEDTVLPLAKRVVSALNNKLVPGFGADLRIEIDRDAIEALALRREIVQEAQIKLYQAGVIDRQEAREALQYDPEEASVRNDFDAGAFKALAEAYAAGSIPVDPLWTYLRFTGLIPPTMDKSAFEDAVIGAASPDEMIAALGVPAQSMADTIVGIPQDEIRAGGANGA